MLKTISSLRSRASEQRTYANVSIISLVVVVILGFYLFIFQSANIAALDIEVQREVTGKQKNAVAHLVSLNFEHTKLLSEQESNNHKLKRANSIIAKDGNSGLHLGRVPFFNKDLSERWWFNGNNIERTEKFKEQLKETNKYLSSPDFSKNFMDQAHDELRTLITRLAEKNDSWSQTKKEYQALKDQVPPEVIESALSGYTEDLSSFLKKSKSLNKKIAKLKVKIKNYPEELPEKIERAISINNTAYLRSDKVLEIIRENLHKYKEIRKGLRASKDELKNKIAYLEAEIQLTSPISSETQSQKSDSKLAFFISSNIARLGIIVVTIFFAQIFFSIYRYSTKLSGFYHARADVLELLTQSDMVEITNAPEWVETFSIAFTPYSVDFGKNPALPVEEMTNALKALSK